MEQKPQDQYKETQILTATPEKLLIMLYDGAIIAIETAIEYLEPKDIKLYDKINTQLIKAQEIVGELMSTLDLEKGGEIARQLQALYVYFLQKIMQGNVDKDAKPLTEVLSFLKELRNTWNLAIKNQATQSHTKPNPPSSSGGFNISG